MSTVATSSLAKQRMSESPVENVLNNLGLLPLLIQLQNLDAQNAAGSARSVVSDIVDIVSGVDPKDYKLTVPCTNFVVQLLSQHLLVNIEEEQFNRLLNWIQASLQKSDDSVACGSFSAIGGLLKSYPQFAVHWWERLFDPKCSNVLQRMENIIYDVPRDEFLVAAVQCLDAVFSCPVVAQLTEQQVEVYESVANTLIHLHYAARHPCSEPSYLTMFSLSSLTFLNRVAALCPTYAHNKVSELFGVARAYMNYGMDVEAGPPKPQKVYASQQTSHDPTEEVDNKPRGCGGKVLKTRKPRAVVKARQGGHSQEKLQMSEVVMPALDLKTSDSDASEPETSGNRISQERHRRGKVRQASIALLGVLSRVLDRRVLYGYWHALFPSVQGDSRENLLSVAQHDPNARCRSTALQVASQVIFNSKDFIGQAENRKQSSPAFLPFAQNLGIMVLSIYDALTIILATESSLPILTQALKCLAGLVQATPFHRFEQGDFIHHFVQQLRPLVYHRDSTIQVSALMVMEFLVATPALTEEIEKAIELPRTVSRGINGSQLNDEKSDLIEEVNFDEYFESDDEDCSFNLTDDNLKQTVVLRHPGGSSWLLLRVLQNLDCDSHSSRKCVPTSVRIESLQVLSAMTAHYTLLSSNLERVAVSLKITLQDPQPDIRLYAARCTDSCAYYIGRQLLECGAMSFVEFPCFERFWELMLPVIMNQIRGAQETGNYKVCLCDALSNFSVVIFERLPQTAQLNLLSFLSGICSDATEETTVRAAAVRALAVYVLFPSLRENLVFIENLAELTLRLVADTNLLVRVKALWSMGNVSDTLVANSLNPAHERISEELLQRLINAATDACGDHDKVRCNAVRTLGNLLRLLNEQHFNNINCRAMFQKAVGKLTNCLRSGGTAKVKWNSCYAIGNFMHNRALFVANLDWQAPLFSALCHLIVNHSNFKVRINAAAVILQIEERVFFGVHFAMFWCALLAAIEQSHNLDNFYEYNHRDTLQEQLCLAMCHVISTALNEDFPMLKKKFAERLEVVRNTWVRVTNRMVPEKAAPMIACAVLLQERLKEHQLVTAEQRSAIVFFTQTLTTE